MLTKLVSRQHCFGRIQWFAAREHAFESMLPEIVGWCGEQCEDNETQEVWHREA